MAVCLKQLPSSTKQVVITAKGQGLGVVQVCSHHALSLTHSLNRLSCLLSHCQPQSFSNRDNNTVLFSPFVWHASTLEFKTLGKAVDIIVYFLMTSSVSICDVK